MKGIPPEIDSLMWRLADEGNVAARMEFESRHARYGPELARRVAMVNELRQAGRTETPRPRFTPRPIRPTATPRWAVGAAAGLVALAVGAVAYVTAPKPPAIPKPPVVIVPQPQETLPTVVPPVEPTPTPTPRPLVRKEPEPEKPPSYTLPKDTRVAEIALIDAIKLVAAGGGLKVTVAPGFGDQKVSLDYQGLSTLDTLKAMGEQYGFSVLDEGEGAVLLVPARPADAPLHRVGP